MTTDDFMFDLSEKEEQVITSPAPPDFPKDKVIKRVIWHKTEILIYPNGETYSRCDCWPDKKEYEYKKKGPKEKIGEYKKEDGVVEL